MPGGFSTPICQSHAPDPFSKDRVQLSRSHWASPMSGSAGKIFASEDSPMRTDSPQPFEADHARSYADRTPSLVPGFADLHRMTSMLLAERVPLKGRVLVLGAGGGLELRALADDHPHWTFDGVDPSADMLRAAQHIAGEHSARIHLHHGY